MSILLGNSLSTFVEFLCLMTYAVLNSLKSSLHKMCITKSVGDLKLLDIKKVSVCRRVFPF